MSDQNGTAMVVGSSAALAMVMPPSEAQERLRELQAFIAANMKEGIDGDYAIIPGTKKHTLLKPGAEKLAEIYGFAVDYTDARPPIERWGGADAEPFFGYFKRAVVTRRSDGLFLGAGIGSCNSGEEKYAARWVFDREVPSHIDARTLRTRTGSKNGEAWVMYRVPNDKILDCVNTLEKMACKRALVMAVIAVTRSSGLFTQDMEDTLPPKDEKPRAQRGAVADAEFEEARTPAALAGERAIAGTATPDDVKMLLAHEHFQARHDAWSFLARTVPVGELAALRARVDRDERDEVVWRDVLAEIDARVGAP